MDLGTIVPDAGQNGIIRTERPDKFDPPDSPSGVIKNKKAPAPVILTDLRTRLVNSTVSQLAPGTVPEKWTRVGQFFEDALVIKEFTFIRINRNGGYFTGIIIIEEKLVIAIRFFYYVNIPQVTTAFTTLKTFKGQNLSLYRTLCHIASTNSRAIRTIITHSRKFEC